MFETRIGAGTRVLVHGTLGPEARQRAGMHPWNAIVDEQIGKLGTVLELAANGQVRVNLDGSNNANDYWEFLQQELRLVTDCDHVGMLLAVVATEVEREARGWQTRPDLLARSARLFARRLRAGQVTERRRAQRREGDKDA